MIYKYVILNIFCSKKPCDLTIMYNNGNCKRRCNITSHHSKICIHTKESSVKITASYEEQIYYKTIYLDDLRCQNIFVNFGFYTTFCQKAVNLIRLTDANYGFSVSNAVLNFKQKFIT